MPLANKLAFKLVISFGTVTDCRFPCIESTKRKKLSESEYALFGKKEMEVTGLPWKTFEPFPIKDDGNITLEIPVVSNALFPIYESFVKLLKSKVDIGQPLNALEPMVERRLPG